MRRPTHAVLLLTLLTLAPPAAAGFPEQLLTLQLGVPVPLSVYGYEPEAGAQTGFRFIGHGGVQYAARPWSAVPLYLGAWVAGGAIGATEQGLDGWTYLVSLGPLALSRVPLGTIGAREVTLELGAGVGLLFSGVHVDEDMYKDTESLGMRLQAALGIAVATGLDLQLCAAVEMFGSPIREAVWYNDSLGSSNYLILGLGLAWRDQDGLPTSGAVFHQ